MLCRVRLALALSLLVLAAPAAAQDPSCTTDGCVRSVRVLGDFARASIEAYLEPGVTIENGYTLLVVEHATHGATSLATIAIPYPASPPEGGYPVVAVAHGTVGIDDPCAIAGTPYGAGLAALFGARGAIGVATDYPGLGTPGVLPYLVSEVEGAAVLDSLRAAAAVARARGVALDGRAAVAGLSEGGHAALAAAAMHRAYAPELDVRAFAACAPANVWLELWSLGARIDGSHVPLMAMMTYAWARRAHWTGAPIFTPSTAAIVDDVMTHDCTFAAADHPTTVGDALGTSADAIFDPAFLAAFRAGDFGTHYAAFGEAFAANRIGPYVQTAPLAIWQGDADTIVRRATTDRVVAALRAGGVTVDYRVVPEGGHTDVAFGTVVQAQRRTEESVAWIRARLGS